MKSFSLDRAKLSADNQVIYENRKRIRKLVVFSPFKRIKYSAIKVQFFNITA